MSAIPLYADGEIYEIDPCLIYDPFPDAEYNNHVGLQAT
jgi:hypothetical protein